MTESLGSSGRRLRRPHAHGDRSVVRQALPSCSRGGAKGSNYLRRCNVCDGPRIVPQAHQAIPPLVG